MPPPVDQTLNEIITKSTGDYNPFEIKSKFLKVITKKNNRLTI